MKWWSSYATIQHRYIATILPTKTVAGTVHWKWKRQTGVQFCCQSKKHNFWNSKLFWHWWSFDPRGRPHSRQVVITIFTQSVRPSVPKLQNQATITAGRHCELAEWIIDDSCLVVLVTVWVGHISTFRKEKQQKNYDKKCPPVDALCGSVLYLPPPPLFFISDIYCYLRHCETEWKAVVLSPITS